MNVVHVDYDDMAVVYSCHSAPWGMFSQEDVQIITRNKTITEAQLEKAIAVIKVQVPEYDFVTETY